MMTCSVRSGMKIIRKCFIFLSQFLLPNMDSIKGLLWGTPTVTILTACLVADQNQLRNKTYTLLSNFLDSKRQLRDMCVEL